MQKLGTLGVKVPTNCNGIYLGVPELDAVMEELDIHNALVIIHPNRASLARIFRIHRQRLY